MSENNWPDKPCLAPLVSAMVKPNGRLRPCCWWWNESGVDPMITSTSIEDYRKNFLKPLYDTMSKGNWPEGCKRCNTASESRYHYYEKFFGHLRNQDPDSVPLKTMDLRFGNLCNASCVTCNYTNSSYFEKVKNQGYFLTDEHYDPSESRRNHITNTMDWHEDPVAKKQILDNLEDIDQLYVTGGEPTINPTFHEMLQHLIDNGRAGQVTIELNTNGTNLNGKFLELLDPFKKIVLFSVDAHGELNDAMRWPTKFSAIEKNILEFKSIIQPGDHMMITPTIAVFNFFKLPELFIWAKENNINIPDRLNVLSRPYWQNLTMLPKLHYIKGLEQLQEYAPQYVRQIKKRISSGAAYQKDPDPNMNWDKVLWTTRQWFESRGYDPALTGIPEFVK